MLAHTWQYRGGEYRRCDACDAMQRGASGQWRPEASAICAGGARDSSGRKRPRPAGDAPKDDPDPHAYLQIHDGACVAIQADTADETAAEFCRAAIAGGDYIERVPLDEAREALFEPWPRGGVG